MIKFLIHEKFCRVSTWHKTYMNTFADQIIQSKFCQNLHENTNFVLSNTTVSTNNRWREERDPILQQITSALWYSFSCVIINPNQAVVFCLSKGCGLVYWAESRHFGFVLRYLYNQVCFHKIFVKYHPRGHCTPAKIPVGHTGATSWIWQVPNLWIFLNDVTPMKNIGNF